MVAIYPMGVYNQNKKTSRKEGLNMADMTLDAGAIPSCCSERKKHRGEQEYKDLIRRLNIIEGQVRGIRNMLEQDAYCIDILTQASAVSRAMNSFSCQLLSNHIRTCVKEDLQEGKDETINELVATLQKLMK